MQAVFGCMRCWAGLRRGEGRLVRGNPTRIEATCCCGPIGYLAGCDMYGAPVHFRPLEREESRDASLQEGLAFIDPISRHFISAAHYGTRASTTKGRARNSVTADLRLKDFWILSISHERCRVPVACK
jgi:hypothetical protein